MKRETAEKIIHEMKQMEVVFGHLDGLSEEINDESERRALRRAIADLVIDSYEKITQSIACQFPDLHPDKK